MNGQITADPEDVATKIARLVEERGWNQEDFARNTGLNRQTVRQILRSQGERRLRNDTICRCARALGLTVSDLRGLPLDRLVHRIHSARPVDAGPCLQQLYDQATQPELLAWLERNPQRAGTLAAEEIDELLSLQGTGGPLTSVGVEHYVTLVERKRQLHEMMHVIAGTEYLELLEKFVELLYDKVQPYKDRK
jgi:transcriptional regulator with XRE-family HTH domain